MKVISLLSRYSNGDTINPNRLRLRMKWRKMKWFPDFSTPPENLPFAEVLGTRQNRN